MRSFLARILDNLCAKLHFLHRYNLPESWFEEEAYAGWRGRICNLIYGCPLSRLALKVDNPVIDALRVENTPWGWPAGRLDWDNPWNDGMDWWGDPTDWEIRQDWNEGVRSAS